MTRILLEESTTVACVAGTAYQIGPPGMSATIAYCSCGWRGPEAYAKPEQARAAASEHIRADERRQIVLVLEATGRGDTAQLIQAAFRDPEDAA